MNAPPTLVMDLEGSDGRERGEDDTSFERQSALFALAIADVLLINMWAKDVGRETGAGKPLLKTIFQVRRCVTGVGWSREIHRVRLDDGRCGRNCRHFAGGPPNCRVLKEAAHS